jgi:hypothetical protein
MAATPTTLLSRLEGVYTHVVKRDRPVMARVLAWKQRGKAGDRRAAIAYNTLAVIHWKRRNPTLFRKSEIFYNRLMARDPAAIHTFQGQVLSRAKAGDMNARRVYASLKAVHLRRKASVWTMGPGSPQIGYHPMPSQHRVGIEFSPERSVMFSPIQIQQLGMMIQAALAATITPGAAIPPSFPWLAGFPIPQFPGFMPQLFEQSAPPGFWNEEQPVSTPAPSGPSVFDSGPRVTAVAPTRTAVPAGALSTSVATALKPSSVTSYYTTPLRRLW